VIAAALHRLFGTENLLDAGPQCLGSVNNKQVFPFRGQTLVAQNA
jgi:hypothetical protein